MSGSAASKWTGSISQIKADPRPKASIQIPTTGSAASAKREPVSRDLSKQLSDAVTSPGKGKIEPRGLVNSRNTCFLNAVLQAMVGCEDFANLLLALAQSPLSLSYKQAPFTAELLAFAREYCNVDPKLPSRGGDVKAAAPAKVAEERKQSAPASGGPVADAPTAAVPASAPVSGVPAKAAPAAAKPAPKAAAAAAKKTDEGEDEDKDASDDEEEFTTALSKSQKRRAKKARVAQEAAAKSKAQPKGKAGAAAPAGATAAGGKPKQEAKRTSTEVAKPAAAAAAAVVASEATPATAAASDSKASDNGADGGTEDRTAQDQEQGESGEGEGEGESAGAVFTSRSARRRHNKRQGKSGGGGGAGTASSGNHLLSFTVGTPVASAGGASSSGFSASAAIRGTRYTALSSVLPVFDNVLARFQKLGIGRQEDAHELFTFLVTELHEEMLYLAGGLPLDSASSSGSAGNFESKDAVGDGSGSGGGGDSWTEVGKGNRKRVIRAEMGLQSTPLSRTFGGRLRNVLSKHALSAGPDTITLQPFYSLHLDIAPVRVKTLADALAQSMAAESVEGLRSQHSKLEIRASHQTTLETLPRVLVCHLKRFAFDEFGQSGSGGGGGASSKISKHVSFPPRLSLHPRYLFGPALQQAGYPAPSSSPSSSKQQGSKGGEEKQLPAPYALRAVVVHHGQRAAGGHYTCFVRHGHGDSGSSTGGSGGKGSSPSSSRRGSEAESKDASSASSAADEGGWLHFDDTVVSRVQADVVYQQAAYLLFYVRSG